MNSLMGNTLNLHEKSLGYLWKKQQTTSHNIANVDTPGYKAKNISFEGELKKYITSFGEDAKGIEIKKGINKATPKVKESPLESARLDGNNVDMDIEQAELARTTLQYEYMLNSINSDFGRFRSVIKG